jgi:hypothetical protein
MQRPCAGADLDAGPIRADVRAPLCMRRGYALVPERGILCSVDAQAPDLMQRRHAPMCERLMVPYAAPMSGRCTEAAPMRTDARALHCCAVMRPRCRTECSADIRANARVSLYMRC